MKLIETNFQRMKKAFHDVQVDLIEREGKHNAREAPDEAKEDLQNILTQLTQRNYEEQDEFEVDCTCEHEGDPQLCQCASDHRLPSSYCSSDVEEDGVNETTRQNIGEDQEMEFEGDQEKDEMQLHLEETERREQNIIRNFLYDTQRDRKLEKNEIDDADLFNNHHDTYHFGQQNNMSTQYQSGYVQ